MKPDLLEFLSQFITENKKEKIEKVLEERTNFLTVVVEDIYQPHNASAVVRTCDCFGIQQLHVIENRNKYSVNPDVTLGSSKWVDIVKYNSAENNTSNCISSLKSQGFTIIATTPHTNDISLEDFELKGKTALLFGNEKEGLSSEAISNADGYVRVPMYGFTESLNISVTVAICLHHLSMKLRNQQEVDWRLSESEKNELYLKWIRGIIRNSHILEKEFALGKH
ncbi:MAG: TrmH family RNA methyltransferase [Cytophagaceae bacterium]